MRHSTLLEFLPFLAEIASGTLRDQVADVWHEAMRRGGWDPALLWSIPLSLRVEVQSVPLVLHVRTVASLATAAASTLEAHHSGLSIDRDVLLAGCALFDVGKLLEYAHTPGGVAHSAATRLRHPFIGTALAYERRLPDAVLHCIAAHSWEGDKSNRSAEALILRQVIPLADLYSSSVYIAP